MIMENTLFSAIALILSYLNRVLSSSRVRPFPEGTFAKIFYPIIFGELTVTLLYLLALGFIGLSRDFFLPEPWILLLVLFIDGLITLSSYRSPPGVWASLLKSFLIIVFSWVITSALVSSLYNERVFHEVMFAGLGLAFIWRGFIWAKTGE